MGLLAASDAGDALVVGIGRGAVLWRAGTATTLRGADDERCVAVAISGDGAIVATASDTKRLRCWHGDGMSEVFIPLYEKNVVRVMRFVKEGEEVVAPPDVPNVKGLERPNAEKAAQQAMM